MSRNSNEVSLSATAASPFVAGPGCGCVGAESRVDGISHAAEMPLPSPQTFFLGGLFALAVLATLYVASSIILPVVLAFVLQLLLQPAVRLLERVHFPGPSEPCWPSCW